MTFREKLEKVCEKCTEGTIKVYLQNIRRLYRFYDDGDVPASGTWLKSDKVVDAYTKLPFNKRRALSVAAVKACRAFGIDSDTWYKRLLKDQQEYRENRDKNERTPAEHSKILKGGLKELKKISSEYKRQINRELKSPTLKALYKYQLYLSMRLFGELPFRNDFPTFQLTKNKGNYLSNLKNQ